MGPAPCRNFLEKTKSTMKKILLTSLLLIGCVATAGAQLLQQSPVNQHFVPRAAKAPMLKALGPNQLYMGPYFTDDLTDAGLGLATINETVKIGTVLTLSQVQKFEGGQVKAIRFGLYQPVDSARVILWPVIALNPLTVGEPLIDQEVPTTSAGWNEVAINEPYTIDLTGLAGLMLGFQYRQVSSPSSRTHPISAVMAGSEICPSFMYGYLGTETCQWYDVGLSSYGNLSVQAIVESENFADYDMVIKDLVVNDYARVADGVNFSLTMSNLGAKTLDNYVINALVDGQVVDALDSPIALTPTEVNISGTCSLEGVDLSVGKHTFALQIASIDGEPVENGTLLNGQFTAYYEAFARQKNVVEQFTSQYCTYCPWGEQFIQAVGDRCGNLAWVGIHGNMSGTDVFHNTRCDQIMSYLGVDQSYPQATFNRFDYEKAGTIAFGIGFQPSVIPMYADYLNEFYIGNNWTPVVANINLGGTYDPATRELKLNVTGQTTSELKTLFGSGVGITVYLTEDGLVGRQLNNGTWINDYTHNHVMRDMLGTISGTALKMVDGTLNYANEFTTTLSEDWNADNMHVVVLVNRKGSGTKKEVFNCEVLDIKDLPAPSHGVVGDVTGDGQVDIADVNAVIDMMLGKAVQTAAADVTGDGQVDIADVNAIIDMMLGK